MSTARLHNDLIMMRLTLLMVTDFSALCLRFQDKNYQLRMTSKVYKEDLDSLQGRPENPENVRKFYFFYLVGILYCEELFSTNFIILVNLVCNKNEDL